MADGVRVILDHEDTEDGYHEWITLGERVRADRLGRRNPRLAFTEWTRWICNSGCCNAEAIVSDVAIRGLIERTP